MSSPVEERKAETRELIFQAALKVFGEKGYHTAQIADIVREAGISTGSVYAHFKDKRDLFEQVTRHTLNGLRARLQELSRIGGPDDPLKRVAQWKHAYTAFFDYVEAHPYQVLIILKGSLSVDEEQEAILWEFFNAFATDMAEDLLKWEELGYLKGLNAHVMGHIIIGMSNQVALSWLMDRQFTREEAINSLLAATHGIISLHLTERGKKALGDMSVPTLGSGEG